MIFAVVAAEPMGLIFMQLRDRHDVASQMDFPTGVPRLACSTGVDTREHRLLALFVS